MTAEAIPIEQYYKHVFPCGDDRALWWARRTFSAPTQAGLLAALVTAAWALQRNGHDLRLDAIGGGSSSANVRLRGRRKAR